MMMKRFHRVIVSAALGAAWLGMVGCEGDANEPGAGTGPQAAGPGPGGFGPSPGPEGGPGGGRPQSPIRSIMFKLDRGPSALNKAVARGIEADPPDWGTIQKQASEYAQLTAGLGKLDPPQGSKDSWAQLTAAFAETAAALDKAAQAKDRQAARQASEQLTGSCMGCHQAHRRMMGGRGGFGMPPRGGFPGGGPPPGGPGRPGGPPPS